MSNMKEIKVKFNNIWDDYGDCDEYEIIIFSIPKEMNIDISNETQILDACYNILNDYDCDDQEELIEAFNDYSNVTENDLDLARKILDNGNMGLIASRIADFISEKYPDVTWKMPDYSCDLEININ